MTGSRVFYTSFYSKNFPRMRGLFCGENVVPLTVIPFFSKLWSFFRYYKKSTNLVNFLPTIYFYKIFLKKFLGFILNFSIITALIFVFFYYYPMISDKVWSILNYGNQNVATEIIKEKQVETVIENQYVPEFDSSLPEGKWIKIPKIGVNSVLQRTNDSDKALSVGVWMAPDYGEVGDLEMPVIVAAHRFGFKWWWQDDYYKKNSFYYLPDLEVGDEIELIKDKKKWVYEVYAKEEGKEITDYKADMILYTCKFLNSPIRHFVYTRLKTN